MPATNRLIENRGIEIDGYSALVLRPILRHGAIDEKSLRSILNGEFEESDVFDRVLGSLIKREFVSKTKDRLRITDEGIAWLDENDLSLRMEEGQEDVDCNFDRPAGVPKKPYDVAKLKMDEKHVSVFQVLRKIEKGDKGEEGGIDLSPDFQRAFVWDDVKQSRLIESILIRIPLPAFYMDASILTRWVVVDGLQRLNTLKRYCRGESFNLSGLQFLDDLEGLKFKELPAKYQVVIEDDTDLLLYKLLPGTPIEAKYTIFSRVNTGGMQLTSQEIRHALNQGESTKYLAQLAEDKSFIRATQGAVASKRMADRELVLRALAFMLSGPHGYRQYNELDAFLVNSMELINGLQENKLSTLAKEFSENLDKVSAIFGKYAFRKFWEINGRRGPLNKALFEVWVVNVGEYQLQDLVQCKNEIMKGFIDLLNNDNKFLKSISASTGSISAVEHRFKATKDLLSKILA